MHIFIAKLQKLLISDTYIQKVMMSFLKKHMGKFDFLLSCLYLCTRNNLKSKNRKP